jgi:hypothetical protein
MLERQEGRMAHVEHNLMWSEACDGEPDPIIARTYHVEGRHTRPEFVPLGHYKPAFDDPSYLRAQVLTRLNEKVSRSAEITADDLVAVAIMRECTKRRHDAGPSVLGIRLERIASYIVSRRGTGPIRINGEKFRREESVSPTGFGRALREIEEDLPLNNIIILPRTPREAKNYDLNQVRIAHPFVTNGSDQPHVLLHIDPQTHHSVENVLTPDNF